MSERRAFKTRREKIAPLRKSIFMVAASGLLVAVISIVGSINDAFAAPELTNLYTFTGGSDGAWPYDGLVADAAGNLYGTAYVGGNTNCNFFGAGPGCGTVYELQKPTSGQSQWTFVLLWSFTGGADGALPRSTLVFDKAGALYGTASEGGAFNLGVVFKLTPPAPGQTQWTETTLWSFAGGANDGAYPAAGVAIDSSGRVYGITNSGGGTTSCNSGPPGCGIAYRLSPPQGTQTQWTERVLWKFPGGTGGAQSQSRPLLSGGALYGTTANGPTPINGTAFKLTPSGGSLWNEMTLWNFSGGIDGGDITAGLIKDKAGSLYGETGVGGEFNFGTVFQLIPPSSGQTQWTESTLWSFSGAPGDGAGPGFGADRGLLMDNTGALYGTTSGGGTANEGTVFKLIPPSAGQTAWTENILWSFSGGVGGRAGPDGIIMKGGVLYGTTFFGPSGSCHDSYGNTFGCGTVYALHGIDN